MNTPYLVDPYGRHINYLRLSVTERCNFRCIYCMPDESLPAVSPSGYLTLEEIERFVRIVGKLGVSKIRITGGEPLLRKDIVDVVKRIRRINTVRDLSITTNGSLLAPLIHPLRQAGLDRINISMDSLDEKRFEDITCSKAYNEVLDAMHSAMQAGFPVKLNIVVLKGLSSGEIIRFVQMAKDHPLDVRFLEFMPLCGSRWQGEYVIPIREVRAVVMEHFDCVRSSPDKEVAQAFSIRGGKGRVGFIGSLTESFCGRCSRIRLTCDGRIFPCLFSNEHVSVKDLLREKASDEELIDLIREAVRIKPRGNKFLHDPMKSGKEYDPCEAPFVRQIGG